MFAIQRKVLAIRFEGTILIARLIITSALLAAIAAVLGRILFG